MVHGLRIHYVTITCPKIMDMPHARMLSQPIWPLFPACWQPFLCDARENFQNHSLQEWVLAFSYIVRTCEYSNREQSVKDVLISVINLLDFQANINAMSFFSCLVVLCNEKPQSAQCQRMRPSGWGFKSWQLRRSRICHHGKHQGQTHLINSVTLLPKCASAATLSRFWAMYLVFCFRRFLSMPIYFYSIHFYIFLPDSIYF